MNLIINVYINYILIIQLIIGYLSEGVMETIHVHNVYNPSPASYLSTDSPTTLPAARSMLSADAHHILLGDFNLHHPFWNGPSRPTQHAAADQLLEIIDDVEWRLRL